MEHSVNSVELMSKQIYNTVIFSYGNVLHEIGHNIWLSLGRPCDIFYINQDWRTISHEIPWMTSS